MEDYPRTLQEFEARFSTEEGCREYLFRLRWPEGFGVHVADVARGRCHTSICRTTSTSLHFALIGQNPRAGESSFSVSCNRLWTLTNNLRPNSRALQIVRHQ